MQPSFFVAGVCCDHDRAPPLIPITLSANRRKQMQVIYERCSSVAGHSHVATIFDIVRRLMAHNSLRDLESTLAVNPNVVCKELLDFVKKWRADVAVRVASCEDSEV